MAYSDVQQTEFNRATENLIETTWTYVNLQKEFPKLSETDSMIWKQMFVEWSNEFEEFYGRTDWLESEKTYLEAIGEFAKERILGFIGLERRYIAAVDRGSYHSFLLVGDHVNCIRQLYAAVLVFGSQRSRKVSWRICQRADQ